MGKLNTRQWNLYKFLKEQEDFTKQEDIAIALGYEIGEGVFHFTPTRRLMTDDIKKINESDVIQKIIVSTGQGIKIANPDEFDRFVKSEMGKIFRKLKRVRKLMEKAGRHNQMRMVFNTERDFIEAFMG